MTRPGEASLPLDTAEGAEVDARRRLPLRARAAIAWNRLLASPRFQRLAAAFPLTRPIALRRSSAVFDLCAGFVYTQTLVACHDLGILELLADDALTEEEIEARLDLPGSAVRGLLDAAVSLDLLARVSGSFYVLGKHGAALQGNQELSSVIRHNRLLYRDLRDPEAVLRGTETELAHYWPYAASEAPSGLSDDQVADYSTFMAASQPLIADEVLSHDPFAGAERLLDVGGGEGAFLQAVGRAYPDLRLELFDLPAVAARARTRFEALGWEDRSRTHGGDFLRDDLPDVKADVISLVRVLHDLDDDQARTILRKIRDVLPAGRSLLIAEPMAGVRGARRVGAAYFFWYLKALGRGRARTPEEITALAREAGFSRVTRARSRNPILAAVIRVVA